MLCLVLLAAMRASTISRGSGCVVTGKWPDALARSVRVLINPGNNSLTGPQRTQFPRGGPVPPPPVMGIASWLPWNRPVEGGYDLLYPEQSVDGLVHAYGGAALKAELAAMPILEERADGEHLRCRVGEAVLTTSSDGKLPFDAVVHTVPPFWPKSTCLQAHGDWLEAMHSCYSASFKAAIEFAAQHSDRAGSMGLAIATPVLGAGARGAPFESAARVLADAAVEQFGAVELPHETTLRVVLHPASLGRELQTFEDALGAARQAKNVAEMTAMVRTLLSEEDIKHGPAVQVDYVRPRS